MYFTYEVQCEQCTGAIGDYVWYDQTNLGFQDSGESGIGGVTVIVRDASDTIIVTTTTMSNGFYRFTGLCAGDYLVEAVTPSGYLTVPCSNDQTIPGDSNCSPAPVTLATDSSTNNTIDFGFGLPALQR